MTTNTKSAIRPTPIMLVCSMGRVPFVWMPATAMVAVTKTATASQKSQVMTRCLQDASQVRARAAQSGDGRDLQRDGTSFAGRYVAPGAQSMFRSRTIVSKFTLRAVAGPALLAAGCGSSSTSTSPSSSSSGALVTIFITNGVYSPNPLTMKVGQQISMPAYGWTTIELFSPCRRLQ